MKGVPDGARPGFSPREIPLRKKYTSRLLVALTSAMTIGMLTASPSSATETNWSNIEQWSQSVSSSDSPSAIEYSGNQMSVWRGEGSGATALWYSLNGSSPRQVNGASSASAPTLVYWDGNPTVLHRSRENHVLVSSFLPGAEGGYWSAWIDLGGDVLTPSTPAATTIQDDRILEVVWRGTNNHMYMGALRPGRANESPHVWVGQGEVRGGGLTNHSPAVAQIRSIRDDDGLLLVHTGNDGRLYYQHAYVDVRPGSDIYTLANYDGFWTPINGGWHTNYRPTIATNRQNRSIIRVGILDDDRNLAYIGGENLGSSLTGFGNFQIEHQRAPLVSPPMLYNNRTTGEIDAIAFVSTSGGLFHLLRVMRCD